MAFAFVTGQANAANASGVSSVAASFTNTVGSGNFVVGIASFGSSTLSVLSTVTDDKSNSYNIIDKIADSTNVQSAGVFLLGNITNAPKTVTANFTAPTNFLGILILEYSGGAALSNPIDGHTAQLQVNPGNGANALTSGNFSTTINNDMISGFTTNTTDAVAATVGTGFVLRSFTGTFNEPVSAEDKTLVTAGSTAATFTQASTGNKRWESFGFGVQPFVAGGIANKIIQVRQAVVRSYNW